VSSADVQGRKDTLMAWAYLIIAGVFEILFALALRSAEGFTRLWPTLAALATGSISVFLLSLAMRSLPLGTAYAAWTGIGIVGTAVIGMVFFGESSSIWRILCIALIFSGVIGLRLINAASQ
jgi:quaternary ammonium compound-resistance protein SugE